MSEVEVLDEALVPKIERALTEMAIAHRTSLAAQIRGERFDQAVEAVACDIDVGLPDFEVALIASLSRMKGAMPEFFYRHHSRPGALSIFWKTK